MTTTRIGAIVHKAIAEVREGKHAPCCLRALVNLERLETVAKAGKLETILREIVNFRELMIPKHNKEEQVPIVLRAIENVRTLACGDDAATVRFRELLTLLENGLVYLPSLLDRFQRVLAPLEKCLFFGEAYKTPDLHFLIKGVRTCCPVYQFHPRDTSEQTQQSAA
jgi:hypothetical protein